MDIIEYNARKMMRARENRICDTCCHNLKEGCRVTPDKNICIYNDYELWKPKMSTFLKLAEQSS